MILLLVIWSSPLPCYITPAGQNIVLSTPFSKTLSPYSSLNNRPNYNWRSETVNLKSRLHYLPGNSSLCLFNWSEVGPQSLSRRFAIRQIWKTKPRFYSRPTGSLVTRLKNVPLPCAINNHNRFWHEREHIMTYVKSNETGQVRMYSGKV
jgi:hypothetical protein